jgi:predicted nucleotidyltransferase
MYTLRTDKPLSPGLIDILAAVDATSRQLGCNYLVVGATARDIVMTHVFGIESRRATHDVDFAIALENWDRFHALKAALTADGRFASGAGEAHRLYYKPVEHGSAFPLDLIPFGGVELEAHRIAWPPDMNVVMDVTAYAEALESALDVDIGNGLLVRVVSLPSLAALKLLAWNDRGLQDNKDAQDLLFLLQYYHQAGNADRLYEEAYELLEACGFDLQQAGAALLGHDAGLVLHNDSVHALLAILADTRKHDRLVVHMTRSARIASETAGQLLSRFEQGMLTKKL